MRFMDINVDHFGTLSNVSLNDLSRGLTVVYGGNGSGKSTLISFLRGVLFGYTTEHQGFQPNGERFGGSLSLESRQRSFRLTRERNGITNDFSKVDLGTGIATHESVNELPTWVNETVYREIFTVGEQESSRFDLLSRLCLDASGQAGAESEIRKAEVALEQSIRTREGNGIEGGMRQKLSALKSQRDQAQRTLAEMRRTSPEIPRRIAEIEAELERLRIRLRDVEEELAAAAAEVHRLETLLEELRRRNVVSLDRTAIEQQISALSARLNRWAEIRQTVQHEVAHLQTVTTSTTSSHDSLKAVRALVSRLEERIDALPGTTVSGVKSDVFTEHLRGEIFSLCDYVTQHESAVESREAAFEALIGQRTLLDAQNMETVLQGQIDALREELHRCEDILPHSSSVPLDCRSPGHAEYRRKSGQVSGSIAEVEAQLAAARRRYEELRGSESKLQREIAALETELASLRSQLKAAARLEDIERVKADIATLDAQIELLEERWAVLEDTERHLRATIERLQGYQINPVLETASRYVDRLTEGDCYELPADETGTRILAATRHTGSASDLSHLSRGTRDQAALALRLALMEHRAADASRCPLILDDVFITSDDTRGAAAADLLMEVANRGQQIIFFTCQNDVKELFSRRHADVRYLEQAPAPVVAPIPLEPAPVLEMAPAPAPLIAQSTAKENTNWLYYLEVDNSVEDLSGLTVAEVEALRSARIEVIDELLTLSVDDIEDRIQRSGYSISRDRIRAWRGQAELATQVPMLRRRDAELLYASGIHSTVELSRMRPETVYDRVVAFQKTQVGARFRRSGQNIDRQQAINWSRWSQHARSLSEARSSRSRYFVRTTDRHDSPGFGTVRANESEFGTRQRRARISGSKTSVRRQRRPRLSTDDERQRRERMQQRRQRVARHSSSYRTTSSSSSAASSSQTAELKFYLNRSDDVEAAPSIGPKTAQRLGTVGIYTVDDLLAADATDVATRLDNRRITADTILQWQSQARLVCQVPSLRGHDAQLLVACGVTDPEELAGKRPVDLLAVVGPFSNTSEGERIVRGGQKPDLEEVTDWISWAQNHRSLQAAA